MTLEKQRLHYLDTLHELQRQNQADDAMIALGVLLCEIAEDERSADPTYKWSLKYMRKLIKSIKG